MGGEKEKRRKWSEMGGATETEQRHSNLEIDFCFFGHSDIHSSPAKYRKGTQFQNASVFFEARETERKTVTLGFNT